MKKVILALLVVAICLAAVTGRRGDRRDQHGRRGRHHLSHHRDDDRPLYQRQPMSQWDVDDVKDDDDDDDDGSWELMGKRKNRRDRKDRRRPQRRRWDSLDVDDDDDNFDQGMKFGQGPHRRRMDGMGSMRGVGRTDGPGRMSGFETMDGPGPMRGMRGMRPWMDSSSSDDVDDRWMRDRPHRGRQHRPWSFNFGLGPRHNPWFDLDFSWGFGQQNEPWWTGPNVCYSETKEVEDDADIGHHFGFQSVECDLTRSSFRCVTKDVGRRGVAETLTKLYECCPGFTRESDEFGCVKEVPLTDMPTLLENLELTEFSNLLNVTGLLDGELSSDEGNYTIFAPSNEALNSFLGLMAEINPGIRLQKDANVVIVSQELNDQVLKDTVNIILGHVTTGRLTSSVLKDNQIIETASPTKSTIRINTYTRPVEVMTANCVKITNADNHATNGVVHVTDDVIKPVTDTLIELVQKNPELSTIKTLLGSSAVAAQLREDGDFTLFAPTDSAFKKHKDLVMNIMNHPKCEDNLLKNHLVPNVVCSAVIQGEARTMNALNNWVNLTRDSDNKLYIDGAQIITTDIMATNGALYIIDDILIPDEALDVVHLAKRKGLTAFTNLVDKSDIKKDLESADNVTLFVPSNEAVESLPSVLLDSLENETEVLDKVLGYHVVPELLNCRKFYNNLQLDTLEGSKLRVNEYSAFPFGRNWKRTVQCGQIQGHMLEGCNGHIFVVDKVLVPPSGNVIDVMSQDPRFSVLMGLLKSSNLADRLQEDGPFTVFAPTNEAFESLGERALNKLKGDPDKLKDVLLSHVSDDSVCCAAVEKSNWFNTQRVRTLSRHSYKIRRTMDDDIFIDDAEIVQCDLSATNGVVHAIDDVIMRERRHQSRWDTYKQRIPETTFPYPRI